MINLKSEITRLYLDCQRNILKLKRGDTFTEQLSQSLCVKRSFILRIPGALFIRS